MRAALVAVLLIASALGGYLLRQHLSADAPPAERVPEASEPSAPPEYIAFTLPDLEGTPRDLSEWDGRARLVNFWATWCAPCRREIPLLKETQARHGEDRLQVIGVAVDFLDDVLEYAKTAEFNYPILIGQDDAVAAAETTGYDFIGLPVTMVVSSDRQLLKMHMGEIHEHEIEQIVDVIARLDEGELDVAGAREALGQL